jgi:hypothetical protein
LRSKNDGRARFYLMQVMNELEGVSDRSANALFGARYVKARFQA